MVINPSFAFHCICLCFLFLPCVSDKTGVVGISGIRSFWVYFSCSVSVSAYGQPHGTYYRVPLNLTSARCRSACRSRGGPPLRVRHTADIGILRLVKRFFVLFSTHRIGGTVDSVPSLLCPNTSAPTASDTISFLNSDCCLIQYDGFSRVSQYRKCVSLMSAFCWKSN